METSKEPQSEFLSDHQPRRCSNKTKSWGNAPGLNRLLDGEKEPDLTAGCVEWGSRLIPSYVQYPHKAPKGTEELP